ncbi:MAG: fumarate reductase subunit C [Parasphingorhabdus sp.]
MLDFRLYLAQRISAIIMAPLVLLHLAVIIIAIQNGLDAAEILSRTQGSLLWGGLYGLFVLCVAIHGAIGLRVIVFELFTPAKLMLDVFTVLIALFLLILGGRAVLAVVL